MRKPYRSAANTRRARNAFRVRLALFIAGLPLLAGAHYLLTLPYTAQATDAGLLIGLAGAALISLALLCPD